MCTRRCPVRVRSGCGSLLPTWWLHVAGEDSEVYLIARNIFKDPFRGGENIIVMADAYKPPNVGEPKDTPLTPIPTNTRAACDKVMQECKDEEPWFGIEQVC